MKEKEISDEESNNIKEILQSKECLEVRLVWVYEDVLDRTKKQYFFKLRYDNKVYILKSYRCEYLPSEKQMKGKEINQQIEIRLNIVKRITNNRLTQLLTDISEDQQQQYNYFLYETLSDIWNNLDAAQEIKHLLEENACQDVTVVSFDNTEVASSGNSCSFRIKYEHENFIVKAIKRNYLQLDGAYNRQKTLFMREIPLQQGLDKNILRIVDQHPLLKQLQHTDYIFVVYEYYICSIADLFFYLNNHSSIFHTNNNSFSIHNSIEDSNNLAQRQGKKIIKQYLPNQIIARIIAKVSIIVEKIKELKLEIPEIGLQNIFLTYNCSQRGRQSQIKVKLGNVVQVKKIIDEPKLKKQMKKIIKDMVSFKNNDTSDFDKSSFLDKDGDFFNLSNIQKLIEKNIYQSMDLEEFLQQINSQSRFNNNLQLSFVFKGKCDSILHLINQFTLFDDETHLTQQEVEDQNEEHEEEYQFLKDEESKNSSIISENKTFDLHNENQFTYNRVSCNQESEEIKENLKYYQYSKILRQLLYANQNQIQEDTINLPMQGIYEKSSEYKTITSILSAKYEDIQFVRVGQNSKHFTCKPISQSAQNRYVKVYKQSRCNHFTQNYLNNQSQAIHKFEKIIIQQERSIFNANPIFTNTINRNQDINIDNNQINLQTNISSRGFSQNNNNNNYNSNNMNKNNTKIHYSHRCNGNCSEDCDEKYSLFLEHIEEFSQEGYTFIVYRKCLCSLRDLVPYLQPGLVFFTENISPFYNLQSLFQEIAIQMIYIMQVIHQGNYVHFDFDLSKLLVDQNGFITISNLQFSRESKYVRIEQIQQLNAIYLSQLSTLLELDVDFVHKEIQNGKYHNTLLQSDYFMLGFSLVELFLSLDYRRITQKCLNSRDGFISTLLDEYEILKMKSMIPNNSFIFNEAFEMNEYEVNINRLSFEELKLKNNQNHTQLVNIAIELINSKKQKPYLNYLKEVIQRITNI